MRNSLFVVAMIAGVTLMSCNDNEESYPEKYVPQRITFASPVLDGIARAAVVTDEEQANQYSKDETFRVFATYYAPGAKSISWSDNAEYDAVNGAEVRYNAALDIWDTSDEHFWKHNKTYAFRGYSPANLNDGNTTAAYDENGLQIRNFKTPEIGKQYDLMFVPTMYDVNGPAPVTDTDLDLSDNGVNLVFKHALSSIHFKVCVNPDYLKLMTDEQALAEAQRYTIQGISLSAMNTEADFNEKAAAARDDSGKWTYKAFDDKQGFDLWSNWKFDASASYDFMVEEIKHVPYRRGGRISDAAESLKQLNSANHIAFMIPQRIDKQTAITVKWTYVDDKKEVNQNTSVFYLNDSTKNTVISSRWEMGKRYTYTIALSKDRIYVKPSTGTIAGGKGVEIE